MKNITIIGAGLVGSLMAIFLGRRGYKVEIFEQLPDIREESISAGRSINLALANRGIRPMQQVDIMDKVETLLIPMAGRSYMILMAIYNTSLMDRKTKKLFILFLVVAWSAC